MCESDCVLSAALALTLLGSVLFAVFSSELIPDYTYTNDLSTGSCTITNSSIIANVCCQASVSSMSSCGDDYIYPCAVVTATINNGSASQQEVTLFKDFLSASHSGIIAYCSLFHCDGSSYEDRLNAVNEFLSTYGTSGANHNCYYGNKDGPGALAVLERVSSNQLVPALVLPIIVMVVGLIILAVQCFLDKRKRQLKGDEENIPPSAENLKKGDQFEDESDIETIEMNTAANSTITTNLSGKSSLATTPKSESPLRHPHTPDPAAS